MQTKTEVESILFNSYVEFGCCRALANHLINSSQTIDFIGLPQEQIATQGIQILKQELNDFIEAYSQGEYATVSFPNLLWRNLAVRKGLLA